MSYKLAIVGFGGMGGWHYENISQRIPQITVKGVVDVRAEALEKAKENGLYAYKSFQELLEDKEVEIVTIATPNDYHKEMCISAMRSGKHVVCEKPVTLNAKELEEVIAVSKETGKLFSVHQNRRWDKDYCIIKEIVKEGKIGKPYFIESRVEGSRGGMFGWRKYKLNGGGMLLDWGVHLLDQVMYMLPEKVVSVYAKLLSVFTEEVDDNDKVIIGFEGGASAQIEFATNCFITLPRWRMMCDDGTAIVKNWECEGHMVKLNTDEEMEWGDDIVYTAAGPTRTMAPRPVHTTQRLELPEVTTDWCDYYKNIIDVLEKKAELIVKPEECLRVMKVIDLAFESSATGKGFSCNI